MLPDTSLIRKVLFNLAFRAGNSAFHTQKTTRTVKDIGGGAGITTQADLDTQEVVRLGLQEAFPSIPLVGEEGNKLGVCPKEVLIVDPIDGTATYKTGAPFFATTIGYFAPNITEGVIYQPAEAKLYLTHHNCVVVYENGVGFESPTRTLAQLKPRGPQWKICVPVNREFSDKAWHDTFLPLLFDPRVRSFDNVGCNTVHFCWLFEGWVDGVISWAKIWDIAAAIAMAKRLGVIVTDFSGNEPDLSIIEPQRTVFARDKEVLKLITDFTKNWPSSDNELRLST